MLDKFNIVQVVNERVGQPSFHMISEMGLRVEFFNLKANGQLGPFSHAGEILLTSYGGLFEVEVGGGAGLLEDHDQTCVPRGERVRVSCVKAGALQIIWTSGNQPADS